MTWRTHPNLPTSGQTRDRERGGEASTSSVEKAGESRGSDGHRVKADKARAKSAHQQAVRRREIPESYRDH
jgi:hypothetical protein